MRPILASIRLFLVALLLSLGIASAAPAAQIPGSSFDLGDWSGAAYLSDSDGSFSHCAVSAQYQDGIVLIFAASATRWNMGLGNSSWSLQENARYPVSFYVDSDAPVAGSALAISTDQVEIELPLDRNLLDRLRGGRKLYLKTASRVIGFPLTGTGAALDALGRCLSARTPLPAGNPFALAGSAAVPAPLPSQPATPAGPTPASRAEASALVARILPAASLSDYRFVSADEAPGVLATFDVVWAASKLVGMVQVIPPGPGADPQAIGTMLAKIDKAGCQGSFGFGWMTDSVKGGARTKRLYTACKRTEAAHSSYVYYLIFSRKKGGYYALGTMTLGDSRPARQADADIRSAVYKAYGQ